MQTYEAVKDKVKELISSACRRKFAELRKISWCNYEHPDSLQTAAKNLNLTIKSSELLLKKRCTDISQYKKVREAAFSNDVLHLQNNSDAIQVSPETVIIVRLNLIFLLLIAVKRCY